MNLRDGQYLHLGSQLLVLRETLMDDLGNRLLMLRIWPPFFGFHSYWYSMK